MILLKYDKNFRNPSKPAYPAKEDIDAWERVNGPIDEIDSTHCPWRIFRFIDEDIATAFRMRFPKNENSHY